MEMAKKTYNRGEYLQEAHQEGRSILRRKSFFF
jgi:hypothetical protein